MAGGDPQTDRDASAEADVLRLLIHGAAGRMGEAIMAQAFFVDDLEVVAAIDRPDHPNQGEHLVTHGPALSADLPAALAGGAVDVVIDFSVPAATLEAAAACAAAGVPMVTGTTGFEIAARARLEAFAADVAIVAAPNMSVGVNLVLGLVQRATEALGEGWDAEVFEIHHSAKRDAPSGTALRLARAVAEIRQRPLAEALQVARAGAEAPRRPGEVGVAALRGGDVVGEHTVFFFGAGERVEITHRATDRLIFVEGALRAARWVASRERGLYSMQDVLFG